jgi:hypothetical protein
MRGGTCLQFPGLDIVFEGYEVNAVIDASVVAAPAAGVLGPYFLDHGTGSSRSQIRIEATSTVPW